MTINLITFSTTQNGDDVTAGHEIILNELKKRYTIHLISYKEIDILSKDDFSLLFIASGNIEREVVKIFEFLPKPIAMLADGNRNSLASALEISAWFRSKGMKSEILHGDPDTVIKRVDLLINTFLAQKTLTGTRIGVIGIPSSWLIASSVDYLLAKRRWGVEFTDISLERVFEYYDRIRDDEVGEACAEFATKALACKEGSPDDLLKAMRIYKAIREICDEEGLQAITLSCFKLIARTGSTGCLAISLLNDDGILAGCEGDLQSIFTLLIAKTVTLQTGFMASPFSGNATNNDIVMANCTIGTKQTSRYIIRSHSETKLGIAIQGLLPIGKVTIVKCGSESLDKYYVSSGYLQENTNYEDTCRTQVRVRLDTPMDYFLKNPLGNHHILLLGDHVDALDEFFKKNSCRRIE